MADDEDQTSKTEDPTDRKLTKLREDGNVPKSKEVNNLFMLLAFLLMVAFMIPVMMVDLRDLFGQSMQTLGNQRILGYADVGDVFFIDAWHAIRILAPSMGLLIVVALMGGFLQTGPIFSAKPLEPRIEKISLAKGFERLFSVKSLMEFLKSLLKLVLIGSAMFIVFYNYREDFLLMVDKGILDILNDTHTLAIYLILAAMIVMVLLAIVDFLFEKNQYIKDNRMSRKELKDEFKESEGDPHIKARQRQIRMERARRRMMQAVPEADVIITNPTHYSVALSYKPEKGMAAPTVVAKGMDFLALRIREIADQHNIPRYEDPPFARQLYNTVEVDQEIPVDLYEVTAKVIAFVMDLKRRKKADCSGS